MLETICTYSLNSDIILSNSVSTIEIMGGTKSGVADDSGQWIWLTRPLRVTLTEDFWKSVTFWKTSKELGSIEKGKLADLIILNKDPLDEIRNTNSIEMVMKNGRMYDGDNLNQIYPINKKSKNFNWQEQRPSMLPGVKN